MVARATSYLAVSSPWTPPPLHHGDSPPAGSVGHQGHQLTPPPRYGVAQFLSKAYVPVLTHLVDVFAESLPAQQVETLLRRTGTALANEVSPRKVFSGGLKQRVGKASELMNEHLGALTHVEGNGGIRVRGASCPLSALTGKHPGVCLAIETFVSEIVGVPVRECCDRHKSPSLLF